MDNGTWIALKCLFEVSKCYVISTVYSVTNIILMKLIYRLLSVHMCKSDSFKVGFYLIYDLS